LQGDKILDKQTEFAIDRALYMLNTRESSYLQDMFDSMENMFRSYWTLPPSISNLNWVHRVTSTDPHDAVRAGARTLSTVAPKVKMQPLFDNEETRLAANDTEKALEWIFEISSRRPGTTPLRDAVLSALLFDEVIIGAWYLPYQIKLMKAIGNKKQAARLEASRRYGDFMVKVYNPKDTIVEYSDLMAERVLMRRVMTVQAFADSWGVPDKRIEAALNDDKHLYVTVYDYHDIGSRNVFAYLQEDYSTYASVSREGAIEVISAETPYKFLPIAAKIGGTSLANEEEYKRIPLLWSLYNSGQWETQNILETLLASEGLSYAISPRYAVTNEFDAETPDIDFRDPLKIVNLGRGQDMRDLRPPQLNQGLEILADRISQRIDKSTVPRILQTGDYPSGSAFASLNLATQSGMKSLAPYKELCEQVLADMFINFLNWIDFTGDTIEAYVPKSAVMKEEETGLPFSGLLSQKVELDNSYFDVNRIYLSVELTEDVPTDYVAKVNAAAMLVERLQGSYQQALEFTGETDPQGIMKLREAENLRLAENQAESQRIVNQTSIEVMSMQNKMQEELAKVQQLVAQLEAMKQQAEAGGAGGAPMTPGGNMQPGVMPGQPAPDGSIPPEQQALLAMARGNNPNAGMFPESNPAEGGMPPSMAAPGQGLREGTQAARGE
jgi:hypothetical protein